MSLIFADSFDHYATADITKKWTANNSAVINASGGRRGGGGMQLDAAGDWVSKTFASSYSTIIVGFAFNRNVSGGSNITILSLSEAGTYHISLILNASNQLVVKRGLYNGTVLGTGSTTIPDAFVYIELKVKIHDTTGTVDLKIDGVSELALTSQDTRNGGNNGVIDTLRLGDNSGIGLGCESVFDDLVVLDTSGSANTNFLGDVRIDTLLANADGTYTDFSLSTGSTHYTLVNESTPNTSDYVSSDTLNNKDSYYFSDLSGSSTIYAVQVSNAVLKDDNGSRFVSNLVRSGTTNQQGASTEVTASQAYAISVHETDPATGAAWTTNAVNAAQFGSVVSV